MTPIDREVFKRMVASDSTAQVEAGAKALRGDDNGQAYVARLILDPHTPVANLPILVSYFNGKLNEPLANRILTLWHLGRLGLWDFRKHFERVDGKFIDADWLLTLPPTDEVSELLVLSGDSRCVEGFIKRARQNPKRMTAYEMIEFSKVNHPDVPKFIHEFMTTLGDAADVFTCAEAIASLLPNPWAAKTALWILNDFDDLDGSQYFVAGLDRFSTTKSRKVIAELARGAVE